MKDNYSLKDIVDIMETPSAPIPKDMDCSSKPPPPSPPPSNEFEEIKIPDWKDDTMFNEAMDWLGCPFMFNHEFTPEERSKVYDVTYERSPELVVLTRASYRRRRLQYMTYGIVLELGYRASNM